jgi:hypothetical protein
MGVDCKIFLPPQVAVDYVACAIAIAGGAKWENRVIGGGQPFEVVEVPSLSVKAGSVITLVDVSFRDDTRDVPHRIFYHFEFGTRGERGLMPRSHPYWLAVGKKVVDAFGGRLDYADCDDQYNDYEAPLRWPEDWESNAGFEKLQDILRSITPVTDDDMRAMLDHSAYQSMEF